MKENIPEIGTTMYCVTEHYYYKPGFTAPFMEYVVQAGQVKRILEQAKPEIELCGKGPDGPLEVEYRKIRDIGRKVFYTAREAAMLAKHMTEEYERERFWSANVPMRRTWERLLNESAAHLDVEEEV